MSAQVEGTSGNGENVFVEWLRSQGVKSAMIQKLIQEVASVEELSQIPDTKDDIEEIANELGLKALEKNKLRYIVKQAKCEEMDTLNIVSCEEHKALLRMKNKVKQIEKCIENINKIEKGIDNQVINLTKQIESTFFDVTTALNKRKTELIKKLNKIANENKNQLNNKNKQLNEKYSQSKKKLDNCHNMLGKAVEIEQIESRKNTVLNLLQEVNNVNIANIISDEYKMNMSVNKNELIKIINNFVDITNIPIAIPILLSIDDSKNAIKLKWKLKGYNPNKEENSNQKIKIEWTKLDINNNENKDDINDEKEMKLNFNNNKTFNINNYNKNENEILLNIAYEKGKYFFKLYYFDSHLWSVQSNIKTIQYKGKITFYTEKHGDNLQFINGNIVKQIDKYGWRTCLFGEEINNKMCNQFNIYIKLKQFQDGNVMLGYITSTIQNSVKNWNHYLGHGDNSQHSVAYYVHYGNNYFQQLAKGSNNNLNYKAPNNIKQGDTFKFSFNFLNNQLIIYHNGTKAQTETLLDNCKQFTFAICMGNQGNEVEITNYEFL